LIGATAIIDFANKGDNAIKSKDRTEYFDFGIQHEDQSVDIRHFFEGTKNNIFYPLTLFTYAMKIYLEKIPAFKSEAFYKELNLNNQLASDPFYQSLTAFFDKHYRTWLKEMMENERKFQPFNIDIPDLNSLVRGKQIEVKKVLGIVTSGGITDAFLKERLGKIEDDLKKKIPENEREKRFLKLLQEIAEECFKKLEKLPSEVFH
jgi:hypothetical protein